MVPVTHCEFINKIHQADTTNYQFVHLRRTVSFCGDRHRSVEKNFYQPKLVFHCVHIVDVDGFAVAV